MDASRFRITLFVGMGPGAVRGGPGALLKGPHQRVMRGRRCARCGCCLLCCRCIHFSLRLCLIQLPLLVGQACHVWRGGGGGSAGGPGGGEGLRPGLCGAVEERTLLGRMLGGRSLPGGLTEGGAEGEVAGFCCK